MNFMENETAQKLRGGYYTPLDLATFLARWVEEISPKRILEPSCGDGVFLSAFAKVKGLQQAAIEGFELNEKEAAKAYQRASEFGLSPHQSALKTFSNGHLITSMMSECSSMLSSAIRHSCVTNTFQSHSSTAPNRYSSALNCPSRNTPMRGCRSFSHRWRFCGPADGWLWWSPPKSSTSHTRNHSVLISGRNAVAL